jgi:prepilin-type N-terminal cleavage/methylation domain-containing protein
MWQLGKNPRGFTLIEVLASALIFAVILVAVARIASQSGRSIIRTGARSVATNLANNALERLQQTPYLLLEETPSHRFSSPKNCDCDQVNWSSLPAEPVTSGAHTYALQTCVNKIEGPKGKAYCPEDPEDKGLKSVIVRVSWNADRNEQHVKTGTLIKEADVRGADVPQTGVFKIRLCRQMEPILDQDQPCDPRQAEVLGAAVGIYNSTFHHHKSLYKLGEDSLEITVPASGAYAIHTHKYGFFPVHLENQRVQAGETKSLTLPLKSWSYYGSRWGGELSVTDHVVITKVVAQAAAFNGCFASGSSVCPDYTEVLEIYNPTDQPVSLSELAVAYYSGPRQDIPPTTFVARFQSGSTWQLKDNSTVIAPRKHLLIMGVHDVKHPKNNPWRIQPDIWYQAGLNGLDLIRYKEGGGIRLLVNQLSADAVRWTGLETQSAPSDEKLGPWEGEPLSGPYLRPAPCTSASVPHR